MHSNDLRHIKRIDLLELMLGQAQEIERLVGRVAELEEALETRKIDISESGDLAEASLKIVGILEGAQRAADLYVYNTCANHDIDCDPQILRRLRTSGVHDG